MLINDQAEFLLNVGKLVLKATELGFIVTLGEGYRPLEMQKIYFSIGKTKTMNSLHMKRLAIDLNCFLNGFLVDDIETLKPLGEYWMTLHPKNRYGGFFKSLVDADHWECNI